MRYTFARLEQSTNEKVYRNYISECLQAIANNTGKISAAITGEGSAIERSYFDVLNNNLKKEEKTFDEIVSDVISKTGLRVVSKRGSI